METGRGRKHPFLIYWTRISHKLNAISLSSASKGSAVSDWPSELDLELNWRRCVFSTERPLHHREKVLEQVLEWSGLDCPSAAFLVIKKFSEAKGVADGKGTVSKRCCKTLWKCWCMFLIVVFVILKMHFAFISLVLLCETATEYINYFLLPDYFIYLFFNELFSWHQWVDRHWCIWKDYWIINLKKNIS